MRTTRAQRKWARHGMVPWWTCVFGRTPEGGWRLLEWRDAYRYGLKTYMSPERLAASRAEIQRRIADGTMPVRRLRP